MTENQVMKKIILYTILICSFLPAQDDLLGDLNNILSENAEAAETPQVDQSEDSRVSSSSTEDNLEYSVSLIDVNLKQGSSKALISWMDALDPQANYQVYRSQEAIDSLVKLNNAELLSTVRSGIQQYEDNLSENGTYYYAVMTELNGELKPAFVYEQTYTASGLNFDIDANAIYIQNIEVTYNKYLNTVFLRWENPKDVKESYEMSVYRSPVQVNATDALKQAQKLTTLSSGVSTYRDENPIEGEFYYGVFIRRSLSAEVEPYFKPGINTIETPINIKANDNDLLANDGLDFLDGANIAEPSDGNTSFLQENQREMPEESNEVENDLKVTQQTPPETPVQVTQTSENKSSPVEEEKPTKEIHAKELVLNTKPSERYIGIRWKISADIEQPFYINIYRSLNPIRNRSDLSFKKNMIDSLPQRLAEKDQNFEFRDYTVQANTDYYYAILVDTGSGTDDQKLRLLDNYIKYPIRLNIEEAEENNANLLDYSAPGEINPQNKQKKSEILSIIKSDFQKGHYALSIQKMESLLQEHENLERENVKTLLVYLGRAYLAIGENEKAMEQFFRLRKIDEDSGIFWINFTLQQNNKL